MANGRTLAVEADDPALSSPFVLELLVHINAMDRFGLYEGRAPEWLLDHFILTKERKRALPLVGNPDQRTINRLTAFYNAVASLIERHSGLMAAPVIRLSAEGFGRVLIVVGKLVVADRSLRDVHRFGFRSLAKLQDEGDKLVGDALKWIRDYPDVAAL
ncbi:MAG: NifX-associated nitrogen fixation protein [Gammaproteobacteria bacterium]|nr:NifX-associated nitrogen fixation protein [Gammaproteobacteria bacterium]MCP5425835.1 NifX-associated nitrogen fixation protein [Gammaproteobacteria bacterium]MCP5458555.1 NifX-associated nitrogen fixation protein [Gammaproteobacteria bacterium]